MKIPLHYVEKGNGEPLLLLHGNGEDGSYFSHQMEYFSRRYRVIAVDTRGHGASPRGNAPFTIGQFAADLLDFMDEMHLEKANILGFSDGGNIALTFALAWPSRVSRLILNGANLDPSGVKRGVQLPIEIGFHAAAFFARKSPEAKKKAELLALMVREPHIDPAALERLAMPVLVIAGTKDMIREEHTRRIAAHLPHSRLVFLPGDHFIANREPAAFNDAVERFLAETQG